MDRYQYKSILENVMALYSFESMPANYISQHDNDPKHTSRLVKCWLSGHTKALILTHLKIYGNVNSIFQHDNNTKHTSRLVKCQLSGHPKVVISTQLKIYGLKEILRTKTLEITMNCSSWCNKAGKIINKNMPTFDTKLAEKTRRCC